MYVKTVSKSKHRNYKCKQCWRTSSSVSKLRALVLRESCEYNVFVSNAVMAAIPRIRVYRKNNTLIASNNESDNYDMMLNNDNS